MDFLEYSDVSAEVKGAMCPGRLKFTDQHIIFKNSRTGKVDQISASDLEVVNWQRLVCSWGIRVFLKSGMLHRFAGFKESDQDKLAKFFSANYKKDMLEKELSLKGWNWGTARFAGSVLSFDVGSHTGFEIPLNHVSQCTTGKNEVSLEFHQNDDSAVSLMEMRFYIPSSELAGDADPVEAFHKQVMDQASVINLSGDAITTFKEIQCLTPRGRYDVKVYPSFFQLHGKTFDYKIPMSTVLRLFILPHKDGRQMFFVVSLDPPIKQGQTRYHFLVFLFGQEEEMSIEVSLTDEELAEKYEGKLSKEMTGPTFEVMGKVMKAIIGRKITTPGGFIGHSQTPAVGCSYKATAGYLYPLERGFIYVYKPPVHIRFEEITSVNFARSGGGTRSFDFEVEIKSGVVHTFSSIEKDEYGKLFDFINNKKLRVKNRGKNDKPSFTDDFGNSDQEDEPDAYLARVKAEAEERDEGDGGGSEDESTDEDFNPDVQDSDVAEEFDSSPPDTDSDASGGGADSPGGTSSKKEKKEKKHKKAKTVSENPRKRREKKVDDGRPKRPVSSYMIWLSATREQIKEDNPGISMTDIAKKGGELWKALTDKSEWETKAAEAKANYLVAMKEFEKSGGVIKQSREKKEKPKNMKSDTSKADSKKSKVDSPTKKSKKPETPGSFKSKEYISDDSSSNDDESNKKSAPSKSPTKKGTSKAKDESDDGMDVDVDSEKESKKKSTPKKASKDAKKSESSKKKKESSDEKMDVDKSSESEGDAKKKKVLTKKSTKDSKKKESKTKESKTKKKETDSDGDAEASSDSDTEAKKKPLAKDSKEKESKTKESKTKKKETDSEGDAGASSDSDTEAKKKPTVRSRREKTKDSPSKKKESDIDEENDTFPEEPEDEKTPPTTEGEEDSASGSGSD